MSAPNPPQRNSFEESAPLLPPARSVPEPCEPSNKSRIWIWVVILGTFLITIIDVGSFLADPPKTRIFEANLCLRYYSKHDPSKINNDGTVDEALCKINAVQEKLAMIIGWSGLFDAIPGILLAVPFGTLADKYGRKWIFMLSLFGLQLSFAWQLLICYFRTLPLQLTWLSSLFLVLGGGPLVASAVGLTFLSDVIPPEKRTTVFLYFTASVGIAELLAPIMAAQLMKHGDWLPLLLALGCLGFGVFLSLFIPETLHIIDLPEPADEADSEVERGIELSPSSKTPGLGLKAQLLHLRDAMHFFRRDFTLGLVIFSFLANRLGRQSLDLLIRYASQRYGWRIQQAAYLTSVRAAANLVSLIVIIPLANVLLLKRLRLSAHKADLWIARGSIVLTTVSFFIMGVSATPALLVLGLLVYNLGTGYNAAMRSVAIVVVGGQSSPDIGRLMAVIAIVEGVGAMLSSPILNGTFQWGMNLGQLFLGLPFMVSATIFGLISIITFMITIRDVHLAYEEDCNHQTPHTTEPEELPSPE
ncbi:MFS general substrate transporter [Delitschia confertaspora ATCC 74209]|uniref:MFS general substrate transporter n=1 Tax=Delitschia confertaspora ATCC 74209 TaxID=1513339 RepID=A0A9P4N0L2_9PLEO|nr:MFS general substrate transporter [Delitschia confertaspora ATCC 74209]